MRTGWRASPNGWRFGKSASRQKSRSPGPGQRNTYPLRNRAECPILTCAMNWLRTIIQRAAYRLAITSIDRQQFPAGDTPFDIFMARASTMDKPRVLELGTKRVIPERSTRHDSWFPSALEYLGTDIESGADVDIIADVHRLTEVTGEERFDIILSEAGFEHFKYPHLAALEIMKALRVGGLAFIQTHQTFPIHAVPFDYFRFSREALAGLFGTKLGFNVIATGYASPAAIYSRVDANGHIAPAFLHVNLVGEKVGKTPNCYIYEYDCLIR